jgi:hypothetical protein
VYGFTGSVASVVLLDILNSALDVERSDLFVVHIDVSAVMPESRGWTREKNDSQHAALKEVVDGCYDGRWKVDIVKLETLLEMTAEEVFGLVDSYKEDKTTQEDLLDTLVRSALIRYARDKSVHRIVTSETASHLSIKAISSCAKGRGFQIAEECSLVENLSEIDMVFSLPLHDNLLDREIAHYFWQKKLRCVEGPRLVPMAVSQTKSINGLTHSFLMSLQRGFDHSMHTVMRSVEKLTTSTTKSTLSDHKALTSSGAESSSVTTDKLHHRCTLCTRVLNLEERLHAASLCFSCDKMLFKAPEALNGGPLPENDVLTRFLQFQRNCVLAPAEARDLTVRQHQVSKVSRKQMRTEIQEFLLDKEEEDDLGSFMTLEEDA